MCECFVNLKFCLFLAWTLSWEASLFETQQGQDTNLCPARCRVQGDGVLTLTDFLVVV